MKTFICLLLLTISPPLRENFQYPFTWNKITNSEFDLLYKQFQIEKSEAINEATLKYKQSKDKKEFFKAEAYKSNIDFYNTSSYRVYWFRDHNVFFGKSGNIWRLKIIEVEKGFAISTPEELVQFGHILNPGDVKR